MKRDLVLFGMQGAGKGTQAAHLCARLGHVIFETGAELRKVKAQENELGRTVREIIDRGDLVPNDIVMEMVAQFVQQNAEQLIIFDGLPRSLPQKESFDRLLQQAGRQVLHVVLDIPREVALQRLAERAREDDTPAVLERRLQNFADETLPVLQAYEAAGQLLRVDATKAEAEVTEGILAVIGA